MSSTRGRGRGRVAPAENQQQGNVRLVQELGNLSLNGQQKQVALAAAKVQPGKRSIAMPKIVTNIYGIIPPKNIPAYRYDLRITAIFGTNEKELTKQSREDYISIDRKTKCTIIFEYLVNKHGDFFGRLVDNIYDRASIVYRLGKLKFDKNTQEKIFTINPNEFPANLGLDAKCNNLIVKIKPVDIEFELKIDDLTSATTNRLDNIDHSIRQFYELLLSQSAFFRHDEFVSYGTGQCYIVDHHKAKFDDRDLAQLPEGKYVAIGSDKSVRAIEGPQGPGHANLSFAIDTKKNAFHAVERVSEKMANICGRQLDSNFVLNSYDMSTIKTQLKGLFVETVYGKVRKFQIVGLSKDSAARLTFPDKKSGKDISIFQYFKNEYKITLKYPNLPCILERRPPRADKQADRNLYNMYPAEQVRICDNQRVTQAQQTPAQMEAMIKACAVPPGQRKEQIEKNLAALKLSDGGKQNEWLANMQVRITPKPLACNVRQLPAPTVEYGSGVKVKVNNDMANWRADNRSRYYQPADCQKWAVYVLNARGDRYPMNANDLREFVKRMISQASQKGMRMAEPYECTICDGSEHLIETLFKSAKQNGLKFLFFIQADRLTLHRNIKLYEADYQIISQDLKLGTASKIIRQGQPQTMENLVNKMNMKLGGLNYNILMESPIAQKWISSSNRLFLGLVASHPAPLKKYQIERGEKPTMPSVVGFAANTNKIPVEFVGDYKFQESRQVNMITTLLDIGQTIVENYRKSRGQRPDHVVVIRDGISEGEYKMVVEYEAPKLREAFHMIDPKYHPKLTLIVVQKRHNIRIMPETIDGRARPADQNIKPGTVIDQYIVNPAFTEFYLNSHRANQGTAKTPRYTVLVDDMGLGADELQGMCYALCYDHQIVNMSISTPVPHYMAALWAARGRSNYLTKYGGGDDDSSGSVGGARAILNYENLNMELGYAGKPLSSMRVNA